MLDIIGLYYLLQGWRSALPFISATGNALAGIGSLFLPCPARLWPKRRLGDATEAGG